MQHGYELQQYRETRMFWTRATLANELGVTRATIWRWEKSKTLPITALLRLRRWAKLKAADKNATMPRSAPGRPSERTL